MSACSAEPQPARPARTRPSLDDLCDRVGALAARRPAERVIIGIVGAPGSGKTTLAEALVGRLNSARRCGAPAVHVPMDGFHLADIELRRLGRADRKGAPDTFDAAGYAALLGRLREAADDVWAPAFDRAIEQPIAGSIPIPRETRVIVTEGNYLLLDDPRWHRARAALDEVWFCDLDDDVRRYRLVERHVRFGKTREAAVRWSDGPDQRNTQLINATRDRADLIVTELASPVA